jgi:hypothetical protein
MGMRWIYAAVAMLTLGCTSGTTESTESATPEAFVGSWRSVTPSLEFIGLSVQSKSSQIGVLGVRLTYSGVAFDGNGRVDGDAMVADLTAAGTTEPRGVLVARILESGGLRVERKAAVSAPADLTIDFVRDP